MGKLNAFACGLCCECCLISTLQSDTVLTIITGLFAIINGVLAVIDD